MQFWVTLWTITWFAGLAIFTVLSVLITIHGAKDISHLLRTLVLQHERSGQTPDAAPEGEAPAEP